MNIKNLKIAISGELGSGKSVLSSQLSENLGIEIISVGKIQRQLAEKYGMTTLEFNQYMETHPELDEECDAMVTKYGKSDTPLILDSRLAWHFVPQAFKIHLLVNSKVAAQRILNDKVRKNEAYTDVVEAEKNLIARKASETLRFKQQYGLDINDINNYDVVIDTTQITPKSVFQQVMQALEKWQEKNKD